MPCALCRVPIELRSTQRANGTRVSTKGICGYLRGVVPYPVVRVVAHACHALEASVGDDFHHGVGTKELGQAVVPPEAGDLGRDCADLRATTRRREISQSASYDRRLASRQCSAGLGHLDPHHAVLRGASGGRATGRCGDWRSTRSTRTRRCLQSGD